jgi:peroxiredoxin
LREDHQQFEKAGVQILGISVDHMWTHKAFAASLDHLPFPLLSDWDKAVCRNYGVLIEERGAARRAMFLTDYRGYVRWRNLSFDERSAEHYAELQEAMLALPRIPITKKEAGA